MPEVPEQAVGSPAFGLCGFGQRFILLCRVCRGFWRVWVLWRSARAGSMLDARLRLIEESGDWEFLPEHSARKPMILSLFFGTPVLSAR